MLIVFIVGTSLKSKGGDSLEAAVKVVSEQSMAVSEGEVFSVSSLPHS